MSYVVTFTLTSLAEPKLHCNIIVHACMRTVLFFPLFNIGAVVSYVKRARAAPSRKPSRVQGRELTGPAIQDELAPQHPWLWAHSAQCGLGITQSGILHILGGISYRWSCGSGSAWHHLHA